jgi:hypothetical protein
MCKSDDPSILFCYKNILVICFKDPVKELLNPLSVNKMLGLESDSIIFQFVIQLLQVFDIFFVSDTNYHHSPSLRIYYKMAAVCTSIRLRHRNASR